MCQNCATCVGEAMRQAKFGYMRDAKGNIIHQMNRSPIQAKIQTLMEQRRLALFGYMRDSNGQKTDTLDPVILQASEPPQCPTCLCPLAEHI
jgi:hypothetical protein